jgi:hypothetical protein
MGKKTKLTELEVNEVSLVDRGAIGERFTVIKSEDQNSEVSSVVEFISKLNDEQFVDMMHQMVQRYNDINNPEVNKGGIEMNEEVKKLFEDFILTVNKNFKAINDEVAEIKKSCSTKMSTEEEEAMKAKKEKEEAIEKEVSKISAIEASVQKLSESIEKMTTALTDVTALKETVDKMTELKLDESIADVLKRLETIEKIDTGSNQAKEDVTKSTGSTKEVFWKSFVGVPTE